MRRQIVAGNWKMNKTYPEALALVNEIATDLQSNPATGVEVIVAPRFRRAATERRLVSPEQRRIRPGNCGLRTDLGHRHRPHRQLGTSPGNARIHPRADLPRLRRRSSI